MPRSTTVTAIEVSPAAGVMRPGQTRQLAVTATWSDGTIQPPICDAHAAAAAVTPSAQAVRRSAVTIMPPADTASSLSVMEASSVAMV